MQETGGGRQADAECVAGDQNCVDFVNSVTAISVYGNNRMLPFSLLKLTF